MNVPHASIDRPSDWVARFASLVPAGEVLDLACGGGRHARLLAQYGHPVLAVDIDEAALVRAAGPGITTLQADLEQDGAEWPFEDRRFAGIVVANYLHRTLFPYLFRSLAPAGILIYETFASGNEQLGRPSRPDFLLQPGELLSEAMRFGGHVVAYEDGRIEQPKPAVVQRICVAGPGFARGSAYL